MGHELDGKIGIIGLGYVGGALLNMLIVKGVNNIRTYDVDGTGTENSLGVMFKHNGLKYIYVCVPTPMENNKPDFNILKSICNEIEMINHTNKIIIIRSTVLPSVLMEIQNNVSYSIVHNPEFLSQKTAIDDCLYPKRMIYGCNDGNLLNGIFNDLHEDIYDCPIYLMTLEGAAKAKYAMNVWATLKITYFNMLYKWCGAEFGVVRDSMLTSGWINEQHTKIPGNNNEFGFDGGCLPKDLNAMIHEFKEQKILGDVLLEQVQEMNREYRVDKHEDGVS